MTGIVVLVVALVASGLVALAARSWNGRFRMAEAPDQAGPTASAAPSLTAAQLGVDLGERATLVQFSSAFCSPCRATRVLLRDVADRTPGVVTVDIDAEAHLDLVREHGVMRTPTVLVLDGSGAVVGRASGLPRREQVVAAIEAVPA